MAFDFLSLAVIRKRSGGVCLAAEDRGLAVCCQEPRCGFLFAFQGVHLRFFLFSDDSAEFNLVNNALLSIFKMDAKGKGHISSVNVCY